MDPADLGRRLRSAREARTISQQKAADAIGVPRTAITQMEAGRRSVSTLELSRLAALYCRPVIHFFEPADDEDDDVLPALYRMAPGLDEDNTVRRQVARCLNLCREGVALERLLGHDPRFGPPVYEVRIPGTVGDAVAQGAKVAEEERRRLGIGNAAVPDMSELIGAQGVWASGIALPDHMSGLFLRHRAIGLAILVNASHSRGRKRFSYAHEYAHALLDRDRAIKVSSIGNSAELVEKRANAFAAAFLVPDAGVRDLLESLDKGHPSRGDEMIFDAASGRRIEAQYRATPGSQRLTYKDVAMVAHHFGVSYQAAVYRLKSLRLVSHKEMESLLNQERFGKSWLGEFDMLGDVEEPEPPKYWTRELRSEIGHLAIEAYRRGEISRGRLLELGKLLGIKGAQLLELAEAARGE